MKKLLVLGGAALLSACVAMPSVAPAGLFEPDAEFSVNLAEDWSYWPPAQNFATEGGYLTLDGALLNRVHLVTLDDGDALIKGARNVERPYFSAGSSELEIVELITSSLLSIGYTTMEADNIRPATFDGQDGIEFSLSGKWENGLNIKGDVAAIPVGDQLHLVVFLAPELHYYDALQPSVADIIQSLDLPGGPSVG